MSEKTLKTRIIHKHDTEAHWLLAENFIPKQGEIIVYDIDDAHTYERFKIGDGKTLVSALPFADTTYSEATTTTAGLMSAADKEKLDDNVVTLDSEQTISGKKTFNGDVTINGINVATVEPSITAVFDITSANKTEILQNLENALIDWGDGTTNSSLTHQYKSKGKYICKIYNVTSIGNSTFRDCSGLTSVVIGDSVTSIGDYAFYVCLSLESVSIASNSIGSHAFYSCNSLTSVILSNSVTTISQYAFFGCHSLTSVEIPNSVTSIGACAFMGCDSLTSVVIPNSVTSIGKGAFASCDILTRVIFKRMIPIMYDSEWFDWYGKTYLSTIVVPNEALSTYKEAWVDVADKINGDGFYISPATIEYNSDIGFNCLQITSPTTIHMTAEDMVQLNGSSFLISSQDVDTGECADLNFSEGKFEIVADNGALFNCDTKFNFNVDFTKAKVKGLKNNLTFITYSELKSLRDNSQLIPGMLYRITDYICTTTQAGTRAMDHKFDIIVQALSESTLSENASAVASRNSGSTKKSYVIDEDFILSEEDKLLDESQVSAIYVEFVDFAEHQYDGELLSEEKVFAAYDYLSNNTGEVVPVIYDRYDDNIDYNQPYFYVETVNIDGIYYDKWRQIEEGDEFTWESASKKYIYTNVITKAQMGTTISINNDVIYSISGNSEDQFYTEEDALILGSVPIRYHVFEDWGDEGRQTDECENYKDSDQFIAFGYAENNEGKVVPVLYKTDMGNVEDNPDEFAYPDYKDVYFYIGREALNGVTYDKWRKICFEDDSTESEGYGWEDGKYYVYTDIITQDAGSVVDDYFKGCKLSAWELKYCLDNDTSRFTWADNSTMGQQIVNLKSRLSSGRPLVRQPSMDGRDDYGNEIGYIYAWGTQEDADDGDSTNLWYSSSENITNGETVLNEGSFASAEVVTLSNGKGVIYYMKDEFGNECPYDFKNIQFVRKLNENGELDLENGTDTWCYTFGGAQCDRSVPQEGMKEYNHNSIGSLYVGCDEILWLPDNVFLGIDDCMTKCNKFGGNCSGNTFGSACQSNKFEDNCNSNIFGNNCSHNIFGNNCNNNVFGRSSSSNSFGNDCDDNVFGECNEYNSFGNDCCNNIFGDYCKYNSFGNDCCNNIFGSSRSETIDRVQYINMMTGNSDIRLVLADPTNPFNTGVKNITIMPGISNVELEVERDAAPVIYEANNTKHIILD